VRAERASGTIALMQSPVVRLASSDDAPAVAGLWWRARLAAVPAIPPPVHDEADVRRWVGEVLVPAGGTWVAVEQEEVVAMISLHEGWIDQLYVDPSWQRRAMGTCLVDFAKARAPEGLDLWTFQTNAGARRFYERHGFTAVEWTDGDNEEGAPDVHYRWADGRRTQRASIPRTSPSSSDQIVPSE
jgi:GNAT superfamily N-acetyltransferase